MLCLQGKGLLGSGKDLVGLVVVLPTVGGWRSQLGELRWLGLLGWLWGWEGLLLVGRDRGARMVVVVGLVLVVLWRLWSWGWLMALVCAVPLLLLLLLLLLKLSGSIDDASSNGVLVVVILFLYVLVNLFVVSGNVNPQGILGGGRLMTMWTWMHLHELDSRWVGWTVWCWTWGKARVGRALVAVVGRLRRLGLWSVVDHMLHRWCCRCVSAPLSRGLLLV